LGAFRAFLHREQSRWTGVTVVRSEYVSSE